MVLNLRIYDGRVVDGHGDLRPEHVFLEGQPAITDCVEYSAARRKADALDDLCALTMECGHLGRGDVAEAGPVRLPPPNRDECFEHLEAFYRSPHACAGRWSQPPTSTARARIDKNGRTTRTARADYSACHSL